MKARITYTAWIEVELNPDNYPDCSTDEERLSLNLEQMRDDPDAFFETWSVQRNPTFRVEGELIE